MKVIQKGLLALGLIEKKEEYKRYLPHGISHHIGLDVHDPGLYDKLSPSMVITVDAGYLYSYDQVYAQASHVRSSDKFLRSSQQVD